MRQTTMQSEKQRPGIFDTVRFLVVLVFHVIYSNAFAAPPELLVPTRFELLGEITIKPDGTVLDCRLDDEQLGLAKGDFQSLRASVEQSVKDAELSVYTNKAGVLRSRAKFLVKMTNPSMKIEVSLLSGDLVAARETPFPKKALRRGWNAYLYLNVEVDDNNNVIAAHTSLDRGLSGDTQTTSETYLMDEFFEAAKAGLVGAKLISLPTVDGRTVQKVRIPFVFCMDANICARLQRLVEQNQPVVSSEH
jgi:hypothetical protein